MRFIVVIPSSEYAANAGARIRYARMAHSLAARGASIAMQPIADFDPVKVDCECVIFSKCHDARSVVCAHVLSDRGICVGVDIFDDYFSQRFDSRLNAMRSWLGQMLSACRFALTSTPALASILDGLAPDLPVHILNDPAPAIDLDELAIRLDDKRSEALSTRRIRVSWFGLGDNPHFPVGLSDIAAFASILADLGKSFAVDLTILTNKRSLDVTGLEHLASLPVRAVLEEWTEEREASLLDQSLVAFLPVGSGAFSRAKSLNRAVTALSAGCQIVSAGYPLYASLAPLIYRDPRQLIDDLESQSALRLSAQSLSLLGEGIDSLASADRESEALLGSIAGIADRAPAPPPARQMIFLIHGAVTNVATQQLTKAVGGLSVASPFCSALFSFDVIFRLGAGNGLAMLVDRRALQRLSPAVRKRAGRQVRVAGTNYWELPSPQGSFSEDQSLPEISLPGQLIRYSSVMKQMRSSLRQYFGAKHVVTSEQSTLPYDMTGAASA